jgi:hypothetical protein
VIAHGDAMDFEPLLLMVIPPWAMSNVLGAKGGWLLRTIAKLGGSSKLGGNTKPCNLRPPSLHNHGEPKLSSPPFCCRPPHMPTYTPQPPWSSSKCEARTTRSYFHSIGMWWFTHELKVSRLAQHLKTKVKQWQDTLSNGGYPPACATPPHTFEVL